MEPDDGEMRLSEDKARRKVVQYRHRKKVLAEMEADPGHPKHGTLTGYGYGCRCDRCRAAKREWYAGYKPVRRKRKERTGRW